MTKRPKDEPTNDKPRDVPKHRQCPLCYTGLGGVGSQYSKHGNTGYYKCQCCGHTWTATVKVEAVKIEHKVVDMETRAE